MYHYSNPRLIRSLLAFVLLAAAGAAWPQALCLRP